MILNFHWITVAAKLKASYFRPIILIYTNFLLKTMDYWTS